MSSEPGFAPAIPVLRILDEAQARAFYLEWLGFALDWEHRFEPGMPLYAQVSRGGCLLHLSAHHGDGSPGGACFIPVEGVAGFHARLTARACPGGSAELETLPWGLQATVIDPFGNRLRFCQQHSGQAAG